MLLYLELKFWLCLLAILNADHNGIVCIFLQTGDLLCLLCADVGVLDHIYSVYFYCEM